MFRCSFRCSLLFVTQAFALDEADQAMLLQTKHTVDKREDAQQTDEPQQVPRPMPVPAERIHHREWKMPRPAEASDFTEFRKRRDGNYNVKFKGSNRFALIKVPVCPPFPMACAAPHCPWGGRPKCTGGGPGLYVSDDKPCVSVHTCEHCVCDGPQIVAGRPFSTEAGDLVSSTHWTTDARSEWVPTDYNYTFTSMHDDAVDTAEEYWRKAGEHEHASVASFSRASLELMRYGAPPDLLRETHQAAMEEVRHAEISFGMASSFKANSDALVVGEFPLANAGFSQSLDEFAAKLLMEGCIGETSAVARLTYAIAHVKADSPVARNLITLRDEEAGHAALAWKSLVWAVSQGAKVPLVPEPQQVESSELASDEIEALVWAGVVPDGVAHQIERSIVLSAVKPWISILQQGQRDFPAVSSALLPATIANAVVEGTSKVQDRLQQVRI